MPDNDGYEKERITKNRLWQPIRQNHNDTPKQSNYDVETASKFNLSVNLKKKPSEVGE